MSKFFRWVASVFAEYWLLKVGGVVGGLAISIVLLVFATDGGVPWWIAIIYAALTLQALVVATFGLSWLIKRHSKPEPAIERHSSEQEMSQNQTGINFQPQITVNQNQNQQQSQSQQTPRLPNVPPKLEYVGWEFVEAYLNDHNRIVEVALGNRPCIVAQVEFYMKPLIDSDPWTEVRSRITFQLGEGRTRRVKDGVWREQEHVIQMPFRSGDTRTLIIGVELPDDGFNAYEYAAQETGPVFTTRGVRTSITFPRLLPLIHGELGFVVHLVGKYHDTVRLDQNLYFKMSTAERTIQRLNVVEMNMADDS